MSKFYFKGKKKITEEVGIDSPIGMGNPVVPQVNGNAGSGDIFGTPFTAKKKRLTLKKHLKKNGR